MKFFPHIGLVSVLALFWIILSGKATPFFIIVATASVLTTTEICLRMGIIERGWVRSVRISGLRYILWLAKEITLSAKQVTCAVWRPVLSITPVFANLKIRKQSPSHIMAYANSITLTPGTVSLKADENELVIHALFKEGVESLQQGEMEARIEKALR